MTQTISNVKVCETFKINERELTQEQFVKLSNYLYYQLECKHRWHGEPIEVICWYKHKGMPRLVFKTETFTLCFQMCCDGFEPRIDIINSFTYKADDLDFLTALMYAKNDFKEILSE